MKIGNKKIGKGGPCFIIAEVSGNHNQSFQKAKKIVEEACKAGVDAIKLQTYTPDTMTINSNNKFFMVKNGNDNWIDQTLYELYKKAYTPWEWQPKLQAIAKKYDVLLFSTPFDSTSVDFLEKMRVPCYKIASFEVGDLELLKKVGSTKKPVIISSGMANLSEIKLAVNILKNAGASSVAVLHCVSSYPAVPEEMNISTIPMLQKKLRIVVGISDHNLNSAVTIGAVALGAKIVEKHVTLRRIDGGPDASFSLEPEELKNLVKSIRIVEKSLGKPKFAPGEKESSNLIFRRSLFVVNDVKKGDKLNFLNSRCRTPGYGLQPKFLRKVVGKIFKKDIKRGTPLSYELFS